MKKLLFVVFLLISLLSVSAQELVQFKLTSSGCFIAPNEEGFVVVPFEGKSQQELYDMVKNNVMSIYKNPQKVMSENQGQTITIRAYGGLVYKTVTFIPREFGGHYNLVFKFKDGRVRIDNPSVDDNLTDTSGYLPPISFSNYCNGFFTKKGTPKNEKCAKKIDSIERQINSTINEILGLTPTSVSTSSNDDNW